MQAIIILIIKTYRLESPRQSLLIPMAQAVIGQSTSRITAGVSMHTSGSSRFDSDDTDATTFISAGVQLLVTPQGHEQRGGAPEFSGEMIGWVLSGFSAGSQKVNIFQKLLRII